MSANDRTAIDFIISEGQLHDAPHGRILTETVGKLKSVIPLVMDKVYEDDYTRYIAQTLNFLSLLFLRGLIARTFGSLTEGFTRDEMKSRDCFACLTASAVCSLGLRSWM